MRRLTFRPVLYTISDRSLRAGSGTLKQYDRFRPVRRSGASGVRKTVADRPDVRGYLLHGREPPSTQGAAASGRDRLQHCDHFRVVRYCGDPSNLVDAFAHASEQFFVGKLGWPKARGRSWPGRARPNHPSVKPQAPARERGVARKRKMPLIDVVDHLCGPLLKHPPSAER